jgi:hypothetical protein
MRIYAPRVTTVISGGMPTRARTPEQPSPPDTMRCLGAAWRLGAIRLSFFFDDVCILQHFQKINGLANERSGSDIAGRDKHLYGLMMQDSLRCGNFAAVRDPRVSGRSYVFSLRLRGAG